ncbi:hypothetical protein NKH85_12520 [Mesorhizobium sp. M0924]|uniref:hypothetical protein n=1 Tax=unclassified Mesorhizobium TaxID=325217 RepID=UPI0033369142
MLLQNLLSVPKGQFVPVADGSHALHAFGLLAELVGDFAPELNSDPVGYDKKVFELLREVIMQEGEGILTQEEKRNAVEMMKSLMDDGAITGESAIFQSFAKRRDLK